MVVRSRGQSRCRRNRSDVAGAGYSESANVLRACARGLRAGSRQSRGSCARRSAWRSCGATRASGMRLAIFLRGFCLFTEGFDTPDLIKAKTLLDELRA
jgi:hypothetical protein